MTTRRIVLAVACAAVAALAGAPSAGATSLRCEVSASGSFDPPMFLTDGDGGYSFASPGGLLNETTCSYNDGPRVASSITTNGEFENVICGGAARLWSPAFAGGPGTTTIDVGANGSSEVTSLTYELELRGWTARVHVSAVNGKPEAQVGDRIADVDGALLFRPQHTCTFEPLTRFTVDGILALTW